MDVAQLLLLNQADPGLEGPTARTALHAATDRGNVDLVMLLLRVRVGVDSLLMSNRVRGNFLSGSNGPMSLEAARACVCVCV